MAVTTTKKFDLPVASGATSCAFCPSAMTDGELVNATGKGIGGPVCAIKARALVRPNVEKDVQARTTIAIAKNCDAYGKPREEIDPGARVRPITFFVGMPSPNPASLDQYPQSGGVTPKTPTACTSCANYVHPMDVRRETGWNAGLCLAKGTLLMTDRLEAYASDCGQAKPLLVGKSGDIDSFYFLPEYTREFGKPNPLAAFKKQQAVTPQEWSTDRRVQPAHEKLGIRAWRKIEDPEGYGAPVYLPILNLDVLTEEQRNYVPMTGDEEHPEDYIDHAGLAYKIGVMWRGLDETPALWGVPGTGKTEALRYMAWLMSIPFWRISITASTELDDLAGKMHYSPERGTYFEYGRLPRAWGQPGVVGLDEPNTGQPDVWQFIRPLTDNSKVLQLDMNRGERIPRHELAFLGLAMNPAWDSRNVGAQTIGDADQRRLMHLWVPLPPRNIEMEIIRKRCTGIGYTLSDDNLKKIMDVSDEIRRMVDNDDLSAITWGVANNVKVAKAFKFFPPMKAFSVAVLDYLEPSSAEPVMTAIGSHFE